MHHTTTKQRNSSSPLIQPAQNGYADVCTVFLGKAKTWLYTTIPSITESLSWWVLIKKYGNVNKPRRDGSSPLYIVTQNWHADVCTVLPKSNANANEKMENGATPLFQVVKNDHARMITIRSIAKWCC